MKKQSILSRRPRPWPLLSLVCMMNFFAIAISGQDNEQKAFRKGIIFEGTYEKADVSQKIEGAKATQLVAIQEWDYGVKLLTDSSGDDWAKLLKDSQVIGEQILKTLKPNYVRDKREVILYAILRDEDPFLSSALLSPKFIQFFAETLGDHLDVVILDRNLIYVFPATSGKLAEYSQQIANRFLSLPRRVSLEVFRVDKEGLRPIGELDRGY